MKISIFGIGYVGAVTAGCLSKRGHAIVGVDVSPQKVEAFDQGLAPIVEPGLDDLLASAKAKGLLSEGTAVADFEQPSLVVVGTRDGSKPPKELTMELFGENAAIVNWPTAEMVKYACNAFHATKIVFANEVGRVGKELTIDAQAV